MGADLSKDLTRIAVFALLCSVAAACAQPREDARGADRARDCELRVIASLPSAPDAALLADLGRSSGSRLELASAIGANLYALTLTTAGPAEQCRAAMERLRRDARVRSVEVDARREIHGP